MEPTFTSSATYQWQVFNGTSWTNIAGATNATYTPSQSDEGKALQVVVTYAGDAAGSESTIVSAGTVQETAAGDLAATLGGLTGGNAAQDAVVTVTAVTHAGEDVQSYATYQWQVLNGTSWTNIAGATNATYTPAEADEGKALQVVVTYADPSDPPGTPPEITTVSAGSVQETAAGDLLATLGGLTDGNAFEGTPVNVTVTDSVADVSAIATYQWQVLNGTTWTTVGTGASYTPSQADEGKALRVVVTYADGCGGQREHDRLCRHRAGYRGWRSVGVARRTDQRQRAPGRGRQRGDGDTRRNPGVGRHLPVAGVQRHDAGPTLPGQPTQPTRRPRPTKARRCRWWWIIRAKARRFRLA